MWNNDPLLHCIFLLSWSKQASESTLKTICFNEVCNIYIRWLTYEFRCLLRILVALLHFHDFGSIDVLGTALYSFIRIKLWIAIWNCREFFFYKFYLSLPFFNHQNAWLIYLRHSMTFYQFFLAILLLILFKHFLDWSFLWRHFFFWKINRDVFKKLLALNLNLWVAEFAFEGGLWFCLEILFIFTLIFIGILFNLIMYWIWFLLRKLSVLFFSFKRLLGFRILRLLDLRILRLLWLRILGLQDFRILILRFRILLLWFRILLFRFRILRLILFRLLRLLSLGYLLP